MVFPSVPVYLDPPNWNHQHQQQQLPHHHSGNNNGGVGGGGDGAPPHQLPAPAAGAGQAGQARPGSMADRARLAKIPQPETALKCPRCDSSNTKFCYFNNYSLSQPRHFCKTCRRYWTRGGALRNVPVGGGCRRNKRSKSSSSSAAGGSSSKSAATATAAAAASSSSSTATSAGGSSAIPPSIGAPPPTQLPFMASLHPLMDYGGATNIGLGFPGMQVMDPVDHYQVGAGSGVGLEQWRPLGQIQQFPFLGGLEPQLPPPTVPGLYHFDQQGGGDVSTGYSTGKATGSELITQLASVKMEDNNPGGLNLARQFMGVQRNDHFNWGGGNGGTGGGGGGGASGGGGWMTDLSGFNASSTGNLL